MIEQYPLVGDEFSAGSTNPGITAVGLFVLCYLPFFGQSVVIFVDNNEKNYSDSPARTPSGAVIYDHLESY